MIDLVVGIGLTAGVTWLLTVFLGGDVWVAASLFGALAVVIQLAATALLRPALEGPYPRLMQRYGMGMALRVLGVVVFAVAVLVDRESLPS